MRLSIYPDGGVARFRVHGEPVPDPRFLAGTIDLAALENGGVVVDCSNAFYSSPTNLLLPDRARSMGEGWENARRREGGNDHVTVGLGNRGVVDVIEVDTSWFVGNAAGWATLTGVDGSDGDLTDAPTVELVGRTRLQPDTRHLFRVRTDRPVSHVRLDVYPDGGVARLRVRGRLTDDARRHAVERWLDLLPEQHALDVLRTDGGLDAQVAGRLVGGRPLLGTTRLPQDVVDAVLVG